MAVIPQIMSTPTADALTALQVKKADARTVRLDPGISAHPCKRYQWNVFRWIGDAWMEPSSGRPFPVGASDENELLRLLKQVVMDFHDTDPTTRGPIIKTAAGGNVGMTIPAIVKGIQEAPATWHTVLVEFYPEAQYAAVKSRGCQIGDPATYARAQFAMHATKLERCLIIGSGIDNNSIFTERVHYDAAFAATMISGLSDIVAALAPPPKVGTIAHAECQNCPYQTICHGNHVPSPTCRSCVWSLVDKATENQFPAWGCGKHKQPLTTTKQEEGCPDHLFIPSTIAGAEVVATGSDFVEYRKPDGTQFVNSRRQDAYLSSEMARVSFSVLGNPVINRLKTIVGGEVISQTPSPAPPPTAAQLETDRSNKWVAECVARAANRETRFKVPT